MVRISGGIYRGRKLKVPRAGVRPTKDMVRQALFSSLGESIVGKSVADIFAGTGAIGLEALSRGAARVAWIESDKKAFELLCSNVAEIAGHEVADSSCNHSDGFKWLRFAVKSKAFDLIVADPPYDPGKKESWGEQLLDALANSEALKPGGLFVLEQHVDQPVIDNKGWDLVKKARYGETLLIYYRRPESIERSTS